MITITNITSLPWLNSGMNSKHILAGIAALTITISGGVCADEIYKWTDEDGNVHYEDRPSGAATEERLQFSYNRTNSSAVSSRVQNHRDATSAREKAREEAKAAELTAAEERAAAEKKLAQCKQYRAQMQTMLESRRVYREDESGERTYLDEQQRAEARRKAEELIREACG